jgi:hypothetical protein
MTKAPELVPQAAQRCLTRAADAHVASHAAQTDEERGAWLSVAETWLEAASKVMAEPTPRTLRLVVDREARERSGDGSEG